MTKREVEIIEGVKMILRQNLNPDKIYLFGSRAKRTNTPHADFDFALSGKNPGWEKMRQVQAQIEELSGLYKVDLVFLDEVDQDFKKIIFQSSEVLYERN
jgi:uncharacterized protein